MNRASILIGFVIGFARVYGAGGPPDAAWVVRSNSTFYGDIVCEGASSDRDGNLYLTGTLDNRKSFDIITFKYDPALGETLWTAVWNGPDDGPDGPVGCVADTLGNLFLAGYSHNGTDFDIVVLKYRTSDGFLQWEKRFSTGLGCNEYPAGLVLDGAGGLFVAATCKADTIGSYHSEWQYPLCVKFDAATGDTIWSKQYGDIDTVAEATDISIDNEGKPYITCTYKTGLTSWYTGILALKLDPADGDTIWARKYNYSDLLSYCSTCDDSGSLYIAGAQGFGLLVMKCDADNGDTLWTRAWAETIMPTDCFTDDANELIIIAENGLFMSPYKIIKYNQLGDTVWTKIGFEEGANWGMGYDPVYFTTNVNNDSFYISGTVGFYDEPFVNIRPEIRCVRMSMTTGDTSGSFHLPFRISGGWNTARVCMAGNDGGVYVGGSSDQDYMVQRYDGASGVEVWKNSVKYYSYTDKFVSEVNDLALADNNALFTTGFSPIDLLPSYYSSRTRSYLADAGDSVWSSGYGDNYYHPIGLGCCLDTAGYLYVVGRPEKYDPWVYDYSYIQKLDPVSGDTLWTKNQDYGDITWLNDICADDSGRLFTVGFALGYAVVAECDAETGDTLWTRSFEYPFVCPVNCQAKGGCLYLVGGTADFMVAKLRLSDRDTAWVRYYGGSAGGADIGKAVAVDDSGNVYVTGISNNGNDYDILTVKYDSVGDTAWSARYDGPFHGNDFGGGCSVDSAGNLFVAGYSRTANGADAVLLRYDAGFTGVQQGMAGPAPRYYLGPAYPNPWRSGRLALEFLLGKPGVARLTIYNVAGQRVRTLADGPMPAGLHSIHWDGRNDAGARVSAGVYICRAESGGWRSARKLVVVK